MYSCGTYVHVYTPNEVNIMNHLTISAETYKDDDTSTNTNANMSTDINDYNDKPNTIAKVALACGPNEPKTKTMHYR